MSTEIAVITCHKCGKTIYVYEGPSGLEAFCIPCGKIHFVRESEISWDVPVLRMPKGAIIREG